MQVFHVAGSWHEGINFQSAACTIHKLMPEEFSVVTSPAVQRRLAGRGRQGREEEGGGERMFVTANGWRHRDEGVRSESQAGSALMHCSI